MQAWIQNQFTVCQPDDPLLYLILAVLAFLAATLFPLSSEVAFSAALACGMFIAPTVLAASLGNCAGCLFNYWLGLRGGRPLLMRLGRKKTGRYALRLMRRFGLYALFLSWLPILGDPLTVLSGSLKLDFYKSNFIVFTTRILRYLMLTGLLKFSLF